MGTANRKIESFVPETVRLDVKRGEIDAVRRVPREPLSWKMTPASRPGASTNTIHRTRVPLTQVISEKTISESE